MSGMANVNSASRPHYASSIPVPRASSQTRIHTPGTSPQLRPRQQADLALSPQRGASPRRGKAAVSSRNSSPKAYRGRGTPRAAGPARELAGSVESLPSSPWNSPRVTPKTALSSQAGSRRAGETQSTQRKKTQEGIPVRHTRGRSPPQSSCYGETQIPGPPEGRMPPGCQGKDQRNINSKPPRCLEPDEGEASGTSSPVCSPVQSMRSSATPGVISFSSAHPQNQPITATVAPFQYRNGIVNTSPGRAVLTYHP